MGNLLLGFSIHIFRINQMLLKNSVVTLDSVISWSVLICVCVCTAMLGCGTDTLI